MEWIALYLYIAGMILARSRTSSLLAAALWPILIPLWCVSELREEIRRQDMRDPN